MLQEHKAGEKLFVDYAGQTVPVEDAETGEEREAYVFVAVLGASSYCYCEASWGQDLEAWITAHVRAFEDLGGVAARLPRLIIAGWQLVHGGGLLTRLDRLAENPALSAHRLYAPRTPAQLLGELASGDVAAGAQLGLAALQMPLHPHPRAQSEDSSQRVGLAVPPPVPGAVEQLGGLGVAVRVQGRVQGGHGGGTNGVLQRPRPVQRDRVECERLAPAQAQLDADLVTPAGQRGVLDQQPQQPFAVDVFRRGCLPDLREVASQLLDAPHLFCGLKCHTFWWQL